MTKPGAPTEVQIFGRRDSRDTQKTLRFFRERRIATTLVDLAQRPMAPTELRRFSSRFSPRELLDEGSRSYRQAGLAYVRFSDDELFERLLAEQTLLRLPLVRAGTLLSVGLAEHTWRNWLISRPNQ